MHASNYAIIKMIFIESKPITTDIESKKKKCKFLQVIIKILQILLKVIAKIDINILSFFDINQKKIGIGLEDMHSLKKINEQGK